MATRTSDRGAEATATHAAIGRQVLIVAFTGVETLALGVWLELVLEASPLSRAAVVGLGVLAVGLFAEHVLTDLTVNGLDLSLPLGSVVAFSATEAVLWALWLVVAEFLGGVDGALLAGGVLAMLLVPQHSVEDSVLRGGGFLSDLVKPGTIGFSVLEAAGATVWLLLVVRGELIAPVVREVGLAGVDPAGVGLAVLAIALFVEHNVGVAFSRRS